MRTRSEAAARFYREAIMAVIEAGYGPEIDWQRTRNFERLKEGEFLSEMAYVVLCSGMRQAVVRKVWPRIIEAFRGFHSARIVVGDGGGRRCVADALEAFGHRPKINAIYDNCVRVDRMGFEAVKTNIRGGGIGFLKTFKFIGPITAHHLAKNIGFDHVKPDRHLVRLAAEFGYGDGLRGVESMCSEIASQCDEDRLSVVDYVLWRWAEMTHNYREAVASRLRQEEFDFAKGGKC